MPCTMLFCASGPMPLRVMPEFLAHTPGPTSGSCQSKIRPRLREGLECLPHKNDTLVLDMKKRDIGSSFDNWLHKEGFYEEVTAAALKRVLARQIAAAMKEKQFSKAEMARRMHTSRPALERLLDPKCHAVTLSRLRKDAVAVGRELRLELV